MRILAIDVSYCSLGYSIYDTELNKIESKTIKFSSLMSITKREEIFFKDFDIRTLINSLKSCPKELKKKDAKYKKDHLFAEQMWNNIRLYQFHKELKDLQYDILIAEQQFSKISDVFAVVRLLGVKEDKIIPFYSYYPSNWRKILFNAGSIGDSKEAKIVTEKKVNLFLNNANINHRFSSQDEIDSFALIMTFLKENDIINKEYFNGIQIK